MILQVLRVLEEVRYYGYYVYHVRYYGLRVLRVSCSCTSRAFVGPKNFNICVVYEEEWFQHLG